MPFIIARQDITKMKVDAIVNAANTDLAMGGGVCGAIFKAAGAAQLQAACDKLAPIKTGEAVITPGFGLSAKFVIHAAGPVYRHWNTAQNEELLRAAYTNSLKRAVENKCESIAFPLISSGTYGYPKADALAVANAAIRDFLADNDLDVSLVVYDRAAFEVSEKLLGAVASYIDEHYVEENHIAHSLVLDAESVALDTRIRFSLTEPQDLENAVGNLDEPFTATLLRL
ncbi:MAG: macro domain-containing protein, partial [Oscillospiraceae bacterium]|nr:macro domain-containing protein [Oscillospiraceae bacterium]